MGRSSNRIIVFTYIYLAAGCVLVGTALTYLLLLASEYFGIDLLNNIWLLAIPSVLSLLLNVFFLELYRKIARR